MAEITSLTTVSKTDVNINDWFVVANKSTKKARKLQVKSMLPTVTTVGTSSESLYTSVTHGNQINLKGLKSADATKLSVATTSDNLVLTLVESGIDLSKCNNISSGFLNTVDLSKATNILGASYGGTGLGTITKGSILYSSAANTIGTRQLNTNGQLLIGNSTLGVPVLGSITSSDASITVTNGAGSIDLAVASSALLKSTLQTDTYNINLNAAGSTNFVSGDGTNEGIHVDTSGRVFMGDSLPSVPGTLGGQLVLGGASTNALQIGNTTNYGARTIKFTNAAAGVAGASGTVEGASAISGNNAGGDVVVTAGSGAGTAHGGSLTLSSGDHSGSGSGGNVTIKSYDSGGSVQTNALFTSALASSFYGAVNLRSGETVTSAGASASSLATTITQYNTTAGAQTPTLADGTEGQIKVFVMTTKGGSYTTTLTPSRKTGFSNLVFDAVGETATLMYVDGTSGWIIISTNGTTIA